MASVSDKYESTAITYPKREVLNDTTREFPYSYVIPRPINGDVVSKKQLNRA